MSETQPRRRPKAIAQDRFEWFSEESTAEIGARIAAAGPGARLELRRAADGGLLARVVGKSENGAAVAGGGDINDSRVCPPICPH